MSLEGIEVIEGPKGQCTVSEDGVLIASAYDPVREGVRLAAEIADAPIDLLVAVGFGLGHHLAAFRKRNPCPIVVYEPKLARIQAALRTNADFDWLADDDFVITDDAEELRQLIADRYVPGLRIKVYPHPAALRLDPAAVQEAVDRVARVKDSLDVVTATRQLMMQDWATATISNARDLIRYPSVSTLEGRFRGITAVVCAAGPSLTAQLSTLAEYRDRVLVIAIGQSLRALRAAGIEPDLVQVVEGQDVSHQLLDAGETTNLDLVVAPQAHARLFEVPVRRRWVVFDSSNPFGCWIAQQLGQRRFLPSAGTVAQCSVHLARELGCAPIVLIGQDLAFTGGKLYAKGTSYEKVGIRETGSGGYEYTNLRGKLEALGHENLEQTLGGDLITVEGWDGRPVATNLSYASFLDHYRDIGQRYRQERVDLVNCTEGGAKIHGLRQAPFRETLGEHARIRVDIEGRLATAWNDHMPPLPSSFDDAFAKLRRDLRSTRRECSRGLESAEKIRRRIERGAGDAEQISLLQVLGKSQKKLRSAVSRVTILDSLIQRELYSVGLEMHKAAAADPTPRQVVDEVEALILATRKGLERAAGLVSDLENEIART